MNGSGKQSPSQMPSQQEMDNIISSLYATPMDTLPVTPCSQEDGLQVGSSPSLTVGSQDTSSNTEGSSNTQEVNAEVIDGMHFLASQAVLIVAFLSVQLLH